MGRDAEIVVRRGWDGAGILRDIRITVDGAYRGGVRPGDLLIVPVEPGLHQVRARLDWCRSREMTVDASSDEKPRLLVSWPWWGVLRMFWAPGSAVRLGPDWKGQAAKS